MARQTIHAVAAVGPIAADAITGSVAFRRARELQYPIARAVRSLQTASAAKGQYEAVLDVADAVSITLGATSAAWLRSQGSGEQFLGELRVAYERGVTQGSWNTVSRGAARVAQQAEHAPEGLAAAARSEKKGTLLAHLKALVQERNLWAHGSGPRSDAEAAARLTTLVPVLEAALGAADFLRASPWVLTRSSSYRARSRQFDVVAFRAMGDHPEFERHQLTSVVPLADDQFYVLIDGLAPIDLTPFVVQRHCDVCGRAEVFYSDRLSDGSATVLKSFASGHPRTDPTLDEDVRRLGDPPDAERATGTLAP